MRIAVSGTHCSGKSTLIDDFLAAHPDYAHEPEPCEWLDDSEHLDFHRQLEISVERLRNYDRGACVIAERCPIDFVAYLLALDEEPPIELAKRGMAHIDLLVVLPLNDRDGIAAPESEDLELRDAMNDHLFEIIARDRYDLLGDLRVIEVQGSRSQRLAAIERALQESR